MIVSICGVKGCFADIAAQKALGRDLEILHCKSFENALNSVKNKRSDLAVVPVKTSNSGNVIEVESLLNSDNWIVKQKYNLYTHHCLLALKGETIDTINTVFSHPKALQECSLFLSEINVSSWGFFNTAASAKYVADNKLKNTAAIASNNAADLYGLEIIAENIENNDDFTTFYIIGY